MAKKSFDKEIQFLRMFVLTNGAYNRQQFAERLGISVHTFDKTLRKLKDIIDSIQPIGTKLNGSDFAHSLHFNYYESTDPLLLFLFRANSLKETESQRISILINAMHNEALTALELLNICSNTLPIDFALPDEKTIRNDLKYLEEVGVISKETGPRPYRYRIHNHLVQKLTQDEIIDLYTFIDIMANTQVPSVQGYLLRDGLKKFINRNDSLSSTFEPILYKYHYYSRILDEAHLFTLIAAIQSHRKVKFVYFSPKTALNYTSLNTNPLYVREMNGLQELILPLKIVYDHQYGRWYLLAHSHRDGDKKYRLEGITQLVEDEQVAEDFFEQKRINIEAKIQYSWLIDTGRRITVKAKFYSPYEGNSNRRNFIKDRVLSQGQWGQITEENEEYFIYEITVNGSMEIRPWIRSFGSSCEVLEPLQLRNDMIAEWKEIQANYESI